MDKSEKRFERDIESFLISPEGGYTQFNGQDAEGNWVHNRQHDIAKCIYMDVLCEFIAKTQPKEWAKYTKYYGASAADKLYHRLETTISNQGLLYVLRNGILAFDIIYCASTYGYFKDLRHKPKKEAIKAYTQEQQKKEEEALRQAAIAELEDQIQTVEKKLEEYRAISLVGIQVFQKAYGTGTIISQNVNAIRVRFGEIEKQYIISSKFPMRPTFEDDAEIVAALTDYEAKQKELDTLKKKLLLLM